MFLFPVTHHSGVNISLTQIQMHLVFFLDRWMDHVYLEPCQTTTTAIAKHMEVVIKSLEKQGKGIKMH